jgi:pyrimidine deaminase RibD-like protein
MSSQPHPSDDGDFMRLALKEAHLDLAHDDVPVGAIAVADGDILHCAHNERELRGDPTAHAEVLCLRGAAQSASPGHCILGNPMAHLSLYRKYRPQNFGEVVGQQHVTQTLQTAIKQDRLEKPSRGMSGSPQ